MSSNKLEERSSLTVGYFLYLPLFEYYSRHEARELRFEIRNTWRTSWEFFRPNFDSISPKIAAIIDPNNCILERRELLEWRGHAERQCRLVVSFSISVSVSVRSLACSGNPLGNQTVAVSRKGNANLGHFAGFELLFRHQQLSLSLSLSSPDSITSESGFFRKQKRKLKLELKPTRTTTLTSEARELIKRRLVYKRKLLVLLCWNAP